MSKEMLELADRITDHLETLACTPMTMPLAEWGDISNDILSAVAALRASAVAEPVVWRLRLKTASWSGLTYTTEKPDGPSAFAFDIEPLYAHPAPAAPVPASVREALEKIAKQATSAEMREAIAKECAEFESARSWHASAGLADFEGGYDECVRVARAALASLPAPEAAPTREEIIEQCAKIANSFNCGVCGMDGKTADAILALKAAPAKANHVTLGSDIDDGQRGHQDMS